MHKPGEWSIVIRSAPTKLQTLIKKRNYLLEKMKFYNSSGHDSFGFIRPKRPLWWFSWMTYRIKCIDRKTKKYSNQ